MRKAENLIGKTEVVGLFKHNKSFGFVVPDDNKLTDIFVPKSSFKGAKTNDKVVVQITKYPGENGRSEVDNLSVTRYARTAKKNAEGKVIEILGKVDEARSRYAISYKRA